jgi:hypothetical protein
VLRAVYPAQPVPHLMQQVRLQRRVQVWGAFALELQTKPKG